MTHPLLVLSAQTNLGNLIARGLVDYQVQTTSDFAEAIQYVRNHKVMPAVLLDSALEDVEISVVEIGQALLQLRKNLPLVLLGPLPYAHNLPLKAILQKPLVLADLRKLLDTIYSASNPIITTPREGALTDEQLDWLKDVSRAARHLTRLMLESSSQAALITHENSLWAYAGQLSREAAQELAQSIQKYWDSQSQSDVLRFIRLQATEAQHMLYARRLTSNMVLALVFDAETPFSTIRAQAGQLVRSLSEVSPEATSKMTISSPIVETQEEDEEELTDDLPTFAELLGDVPPPIPPKASQVREPKTPVSVMVEAKRPAPLLPPEAPPQATSHPLFAPNFSNETSPAPQRHENAPPHTETYSSDLSDMAVTRVSSGQPREDPQSVIETRPQSVTEVAHRIVLEPASAAMYNLYYACLLVPRFEHHVLTGDVNDRLAAWVPQACVAFGWRLEHISVRPDYLQWVVSVPPSTAPGYIMRIIRQQTSDRIFNEFPRFKVENPSGDFWAPGYLIMGGSQPHPQKLVRDFITQTRQRQGLNREL